MEITQFLGILGITSATMIAVAVVFAFLGKYAINFIYDSLIEGRKKQLAEELEEFKSGLERDSRSFQHQLDIKLDRYNVQFSRLHEERANIIKQMHTKLLEVHSAVSDYTAIGRVIKSGEDTNKAEEARIERANKAIFDINNFTQENCIYFEKPLATKLEKIRNAYYSTAIDYMFLKQSQQYAGHDEYMKNVDKWKDINEKIRGELQNALKELEDEFRKLLGVACEEKYERCD